MPIPELQNPRKESAGPVTGAPLLKSPAITDIAVERLDAIRRRLDQMMELAKISADPAVDDSERVALQAELDRLRGEIDRIATGLEQY